MLILKTRKPEAFHELLKLGSVGFDPRPGWLLVRVEPGSRKSDLKWIHPDDSPIEWVRRFTFEE